MTGKEIVKILKRDGWEVSRITGSHHILKKKGFIPVSVPVHSNRDLPTGTVKSISKQVNIEFK